MASGDERQGRFIPRWSGLLPQTLSTPPIVTKPCSRRRSLRSMLEGPRTISLRRILIADDEPDIRDRLVALLSQFKHGQDYAVSTASDGPAALQAVLRERPELVLLAHNMPGMTGLELLKRMHRIDPGIRVILITGTLNTGDVAEALKHGAFSCVPKPVAGQYIDALVAIALPRQQARP